MALPTSISLVLLLTALSLCEVAVSADKPTHEELRARADAAQGQKCAEVCMDAAQDLVEYSNELFTNGDVDKAQATMKDAVMYARKATDGAIQSHKRQKKTEIELRKLAKRMRDILQTLALDDRPQVEAGVSAVEKMRTDLLMSLFSKD